MKWLILLALLSSCVSVMEKAGRVIDGSAFAEKTISKYSGAGLELAVIENKESEQSVVIGLSAFPMIAFRGSMPDEDGGFYLISLEYLAGSNQGWNEFTMDILGEGSLALNGTAVLQIPEPAEPVQISAGRIQRHDTRIVGTDALTALRNRNERITALTEWMASIENAPHGQTIDGFEKHWKPVLFPEMVKAKERPNGWQQAGDTFERAEDIRWNTGYTERTFSEELWPVRNSGTMLRDWEEALSQIYYNYEWETIVEMLSRENTLQQTR